MWVFGYSINVLTMFAMVLAVGILVDDAIVVIENVERIMSEEGLSPRDATKKAMGQITAALVGISVTLVSVFLPMAFFTGSVGNIYRQFSLVMVSAMLFSVFLALSLTPALCATFLKPVEAGHKQEKGGFFGWFNRGFKATTHGYEGWVAKILRRTGRFLVMFALIVAVVVLHVHAHAVVVPADRGPGLPDRQRAAAAGRDAGAHARRDAAGRGLLPEPARGRQDGERARLQLLRQRPERGARVRPAQAWDERKGAEHSAQALAGRAFGALSRRSRRFHLRARAAGDPRARHRDRLLVPPAGSRRQRPRRAARARATSCSAWRRRARCSPAFAPTASRTRRSCRSTSTATARARSASRSTASTPSLSTSLGSSYVNDFPNAGRLQRVVVQADAPDRMQPDDLLQLNVLNNQGKPVPMAALATTRWITGPIQTIRFNGYPTMRISGDAAPGYSTGDAMNEMERLAGQLPAGFAFEWTGQSREERLSGSTATILLAFSMLAVFLCLSALYESWSIPFAVLLAVPLGVLGAVLGATLRGMPNDVFFKVGLITVIGLSAKNAILIIEFAKDLVAQGKDVIEATLQAVHLRFRPILMTSIAFILGVLPLVVSSGAGSASQRAIGTGVMGGMITATVLAIFFVPVFFVVVRRIFKSQVMATAGAAPLEPAPARTAAGRRGRRPCVSGRARGGSARARSARARGSRWPVARR